MAKDIEDLLINLTTPLLSQYGTDFNKIPERERYFAFELFKKYREIDNSRRQLEISKILIELSPKKTKRISKQEYLIHQINTYLQEIYIIKLRIDDFLKFIQKMYKKTTLKGQTGKLCNDILDSVNIAFQDLVKIRGAHVHEKRFEDKFTSTMMQFEFVATFDETYIGDSDWTYKATKFTWKNKTKDINKSIDALLKSIFERIVTVISSGENIIVPSTIIDHKNNTKKK